MKKTVIATLLLLSAGLLLAKNKIIVKGDIAVMDFRPVYAGQCKVDFEGKKDIRDLLNDHSIQPQDLLQEVWAWKNNNPGTRFSSNPSLPKNRYFPTHLPYKHLENLKEGDTLYITIDGINYELKAHQSGIKYGTDSFEKTLAQNKSEFDKKANWFGNDKDFLLEKNILRKPLFQEPTHGSNKIEPLTDKNGKRAGVVARCFHQLKWVLKNGA